MHFYHVYKSTDEEKRRLRIELDRVRRALTTQKIRRDEADKTIREWERKYQELEKVNDKLREENEEIKRQRDTYKKMLFKKNIAEKITDTLSNDSLLNELTPQKNRGGQVGHTGHGRTGSLEIDVKKRIYMDVCPDCHTKLKRSQTITTHTVEDIQIGRASCRERV